jgi:glycosyltransferase involved in cell wall biosynthesis
MLFRDKTILIISPESWNHIFVSKHHYATHLGVLGNRVFFLNPPAEKFEVSETGFKNVRSVTYPGFLPGLRFLPSFVQKYFIRKRFQQIQNLCSAKFDVVWSFDNSVFFDFSSLPDEVVTISHIVDLNQNFQTEKAAASADFCLCTTEYVLDRLKQYNPRVFKINHGFNSIQSFSQEVKLPGTAKIKALYSGNLAMPFIDWQLIETLVNRNQTIDFVFVGPNADAPLASHDQSQARNKMRQSGNCFFIGSKPASELVGYLKAADVLLVAYQEKHHIDQANPHKMMEYLGSGKMVIATFTSEYRQVAEAGLIIMTDSNQDFPRVFEKAISEVDIWNAEGKTNARVAFALENSYYKHIERIESHLNEK